MHSLSRKKSNHPVITFPKYYTIPFTQDAYAKMQADVDRLLVQEKAIIERVQVAREMGDLSENGAYKYAKFELGNTRREIGRLKRLLLHGKVIPKKVNPLVVGFGTTVCLLLKGKEITYTLVSKHESDPAQGKLSQESPLGQALLGRKVGDVFLLDIPAGVVEYRILRVD